MSTPGASSSAQVYLGNILVVGRHSVGRSEKQGKCSGSPGALLQSGNLSLNLRPWTFLHLSGPGCELGILPG